MSAVSSRTDHAASTSAAQQTPWNVHGPSGHQAAAALRRSYAANVEQTYLANLARREEALQRWRGLTRESELG